MKKTNEIQFWVTETEMNRIRDAIHTLADAIGAVFCNYYVKKDEQDALQVQAEYEAFIERLLENPMKQKLMKDRNLDF
jgi:hypothetical protein